MARLLRVLIVVVVVTIAASNAAALLITDVSPTTYTGPLGGQAGPIMGTIKNDSTDTYFSLLAELIFGPPEFSGTFLFALNNVPNPIDNPGDEYTGPLGSLGLTPIPPPPFDFLPGFAVGTYHGTLEVIATIFPDGCSDFSCTVQQTATWPDPITIHVTPAPVPEPATWALVASGLAAVAGRAFRRRTR
jgi:hypothetical protein